MCHCSSMDERLHQLFWIVTVRYPLPKGERLPFKMLRLSLSLCSPERREHDCNKALMGEENTGCSVANGGCERSKRSLSQCFSLYGSKTSTCSASRKFWLVSKVRLAQKQLVKERKVRLSSSKCLNNFFRPLGRRMMVLQLDTDMNISMAGQ